MVCSAASPIVKGGIPVADLVTLVEVGKRVSATPIDWESFALGAECMFFFIVASVTVWLRRLWQTGRMTINGKGRKR